MKVGFTPEGWEDYQYWQQTDKRLLKRVNELIRDICRDPHDGIGKPERLRHALSGYWSRRINEEHRLVYAIDGDVVWIVQARYHYE